MRVFRWGDLAKVASGQFWRNWIVEESGSPLESSNPKHLGQDFYMPVEVLLDCVPVAPSWTQEGPVVE